MSAIYTDTTPRSYLPDEEREALLREGGLELVYLAESQRAGRAGDEAAAWAWLSRVELPADALLTIKSCTSAQFVRDKGLLTAQADATYGPDWLDRA